MQISHITKVSIENVCFYALAYNGILYNTKITNKVNNISIYT